MRILYVTAHYPPDFVSGATLQVQQLAEQFAREGHDVAVVSGNIRRGLADGETLVEWVSEVLVHWIGTSCRVDQDLDENWWNPTATALIQSVIDAVRPDVVHAHALQTLGADFLDGAAGIATVVTMHDFWWWCARLFLVDGDLNPCPLDTTSSDCPCARTAAWRRERAHRLAESLARVGLVLVPSRSMLDAVIANGLDPGVVDVDENHIDHVATPIPDPSPHDGEVRFLYVGGNSPLKGRDVVLDAVALLRGTFGWNLRAFGVERPRGRLAKRQWRRVEFLPPYDNDKTSAVLSRADVLLVPSIARESYSIATREALTSGVAVITSDCLGPTEVVEDGRNGLVVPSGDPEALASAMRALVNDRRLLDRMRSAARSSSPPQRTVAEHADGLLERYRALESHS